MQLRTTTIGYKSEFARFRFYHLVALYIQGGLVAKTFGQVSVFPNIKVITKSLGHIKSLLKDFDNGVKLQNYSEQKNLKIHLQQLHIELLSAPRKEKETETAQLRRFLESFAKASIYAFGEASTTILLEMAAMMGWNCDQSTMEGVVRKAKSNKRKKLIELLLDYPIKKDKF